MINYQRREFYSTKNLDSLYVQGKQKLSSALFYGTTSKQINKTQAHLCHYVNLRLFYTAISKFHTNEFLDFVLFLC